jgi:hypothetical protein
VSEEVIDEAIDRARLRANLSAGACPDGARRDKADFDPGG